MCFIDSTRIFAEELSLEHLKTMQTLYEILQQKPLASTDKSDNNGLNMLICEIQIAKDINSLLTQVNQGIKEKTINLDKENMKAFQENIGSLQLEADRIYKEFFGDRSGWKNTPESMHQRLKKKDKEFKELFTLFENVTEKTKAVKPEEEKSKTLETKIAYLNKKLVEGAKETDKKEELLKQYEQNVQTLQLELNKKEEDIKKLIENIELSHKDIEKIKYTNEELQRNLNEKQSLITELNLTIDKLNSEVEVRKHKELIANKDITENLNIKIENLQRELYKKDSDFQGERDCLNMKVEQQNIQIEKQLEQMRINDENYNREADEFGKQMIKHEEIEDKLTNSLKSYEIIMEKLKDLKENYIKLTSVSSPGKSVFFQQINDDIEGASLLVDVFNNYINQFFIGNKG